MKKRYQKIFWMLFCAFGSYVIAIIFILFKVSSNDSVTFPVIAGNQPVRTFSWRKPVFEGQYNFSKPLPYLKLQESWEDDTRHAQNTIDKFKIENVQLHSFTISRQQSIGCILFRTALYSPNQNYLVLNRIYNPQCNLPINHDTIQNICNIDDDYGVNYCKCELSLHLRLFCFIGLKSDTKSNLRYLYLNNKSVQIPIEKLIQKDDDNNKIHICVHGTLYPDQSVQGDSYLPELMKEFAYHHSKIGANVIHFYLNGSHSLLEQVSEFTKKENNNGSLILFHDTFYPLFSGGSKLTGKERKVQNFVQGDCFLRSVLMGAALVFMIDVDEFIYPKILVPLQEQKNLLFAAGKEKDGALVVWLPSFMFHTHYCIGERSNNEEDVTFRGRIRRMNVAKIDDKTFRGRKKGMYRITNAEDAIFGTFPDVHHSLFSSRKQGLSKNQVDSERFHLHHFREPHHPKVCSKTVGIDPIPVGKFDLHPPEIEE